jgi:hypothetical protein
MRKAAWNAAWNESWNALMLLMEAGLLGIELFGCAACGVHMHLVL